MSMESTVAARARCAKLMLGAPDLKTSYEELGGLPEDLETLVSKGDEVAALDLAQASAVAGATGAVIVTMQSFAELQRSYGWVIAVLLAVRSDLEKGGASADLLSRVDQILANEAPLTVTTTETDGTTKRRATRERSQEALRQEILRDSEALLSFTEIAPALERRKLTRARLEGVRDSAKALAGKLADKTAKKGARSAATEAKREAIKAQSECWNACRRLLALVGERDERVAALLKEAVRK